MEPRYPASIAATRGLITPSRRPAPNGYSKPEDAHGHNLRDYAQDYEIKLNIKMVAGARYMPSLQCLQCAAGLGASRWPRTRPKPRAGTPWCNAGTALATTPYHRAPL